LALTTSIPTFNIGFLTVLHESTGYMGGYLVTNQWGRPLEFRLSTAVQPNRVQQVLYGETLKPYICADLIGRTLVEKTATPAQIILTDTEVALDLRLRLEAPLAWIAPPGTPARSSSPALNPCPCPNRAAQGLIFCHTQYPKDVPAIREALDRCDALDFTEPFARIREAINEARKMGITGRGAAA
jgi:hypothetical protein